MAIFTSRPALRWLAPVAVLGVVAGAGLVASTATADRKLPPRSAEQLLVAVQSAKVDGLSGTVTQTANLGIPELPGSSKRSADFNSLISGTHTLRVWTAAPDKARVALLGTLGESNLISNGRDLWTWSSDDNAATHRTIDPGARAKARAQAQTQPTNMPKTPQEAAQRFLATVGPTTAVSTASNVTVAGRSAYALVLEPKDSRSLIRQVRIAVDGQYFVPLGVQVYAAGADPVAQVSFTSVDFAKPDDGQFAFNPPPGAKVTEVQPGTDANRAKAAQQAQQKQRAATQPKVVGKGWTTVVVSKVGTSASQQAQQAGQFGALLDRLPRVSGAWGSGRVLAGTAFSLVLTDDGRMAVGAVKPALLYSALKG